MENSLDTWGDAHAVWNGEYWTNFEHGVSIGSSGDVGESASRRDHQIELILDEVGEWFHAIVAPANANELNQSKFRKQFLKWHRHDLITIIYRY